MKKIGFLVLLVVAATLLSGCTKLIDERPPEEFFQCREDDDCIATLNWGCGCGCPIAINKNYENEFTQFRVRNSCTDILQIVSPPLCTPCMEGKPACIEGRCGMVGEDYTTPFMECVECHQGDERWGGKECCTESFEEDCISQGGAAIWNDLHPMYTVLRQCFKKAPDAGSACALGEECLSGACDLSVAAGKCELVSTEDYRIVEQFGKEEEFFKKTYECTTAHPGECTEAPIGGRNPGGVSHYFSMDGNKLIEVREEGPIS